MRRLVMSVLLLTLVLVAALGGSGYGAILPEATSYTTAAECYTCHQGTGPAVGKVDFAVPLVDYNKCATCHALDPVKQHYHRQGRCNGCHAVDQPPVITDYGYAFWSSYSSPYGTFLNSSSLSTTAQALHTRHAGSGWVNTLGSGRCNSCHQAAACSACHSDSVSHTAHADSRYPAVASWQANGTTYAESPSTCVNSACHDPAKAATAEFVPACGSCHPARTVGHGYDTGDHLGVDGSAEGVACTSCHSLELSAAHGDPGATGASCAKCHPLPRESFGAWDQSCATGNCHTATSSRPMHGGTAAAHAVATDNQICLDCHTGTELGSIHSTATSKTTGAASCLVCHTTAGAPTTSDCTTCHFTFGAHYDPVAHQSTSVTCNGSGCHDVTLGLVAVHEQRNTAFDCWGCHNSARLDVQSAIDNHLTGCGDCHSSISGLGGHQAAHWPTPPLYDTAPRYSYYTGSDGAAPTEDCLGCHVSNLVDEHMGIKDALGNITRLPRLSSTGVALTCDSCHGQPAGSQVQSAIANSQSSCESCHDVHGPMPAVHSSGFAPIQQVPCAACHKSDLTAEHNSDYVSSAGLTGCNVCHKLFTGTLGTTVQDAISVTNDVACAACHAASHPDAGGHAASTTATQACAECHDEGGTTQIDVRIVHASSDVGACDVCHRSTRLGSISDHSAECASCHTAEPKTYHRNLPAEHTFSSMAASCIGASCHVANTLPEEHERFVSGSAFASSCAMCHDNPAVSLASADCSTCHTVHGDITAIHTAATPTRCLTCHETGNALLLHVSETTGKTDCALCHNSTTTLPKPITCDACHSPEGTDFHKDMNSAHESTEINSSCTIGTGCHVSALMPQEHERYAAAGTTSCDLCHMNSAVTTLGKAGKCSGCHEIHGEVDHVAKASVDCVACHETGDVLLLHKKADGTADCGKCHAAPSTDVDWSKKPTVDCVSCHGPASLMPLSPADHYPMAAHDASAETGCNQCHYKDMKLEHFLATVAPTVTCVSCHELKVDAFSGEWNKTCGACHPNKHGNQNTKHVSASTGCGGAGCHDISNVENIHRALAGSGCGTCHKSLSARATTTNCTASGCHTGVGTNHHEAHNASTVIDSGCRGCHFTYLDDEHAALGFTCDTCHKSAVATVQSAIAANDLRCKSCHPTMHAKQDYEFNPKMAGGHRVSTDLPGMQSSFTIGNSTYTMAIPSAASFLKTGWTTNSIVPCDGCHSYSGATGPHGATMRVNMDPAYPGAWKTAYLRSGTTLGMSSNTIICAKCHDLNGTGSSFSNNVHGDGDHQDSSDGQCAKCHVQVPHGWGRPRLLGSVADGAPYAPLPTGLNKFTLKSYTPTSWSDSNCYAACAGDHSTNISNPWPNSYTAPAVQTGNVTGTVKNSSGAAITGATISIAGRTATTTSTGYSITGIAPGTYTMSVSASGYNAWSGSVTITANTTATQNLTLSTVPTTQYGNVSGTVKNFSNAAISGATVSIAGKTATTTSTGTYSITGIAAGTYTMTASATGYNTWSGSVAITANTTAAQNVTLTAVAPSATNMARTGVASASSTDSSNYASQAIDGNTNTYWRSTSGSTQWLRVDLRATKTVNKVVVNWYDSRYARSYRIETSPDGSNWSQRYSTTYGNGGIDEITFSAVSARYVRVYCTSANDSNYRINEFEVWGY